MGCFGVSAPAPVNYGKQTSDTLQSQINLAPAQFAAESNPGYGQPAYTNLAMVNMNQLLNGTAGGQTYNGTGSMDASASGWYNQATGAFVSANGPGQSPGTGDVYAKKNSPFAINTSYTTQATPGLNSMLASANTAQRSADISDVQNLGLASTNAMLAADPYNAELLQKLNASANSQLDAGSSLTPDEQRVMQQQSRAAFAARGMGGSNGAIADELLKQFNLGQQLLTQRQQFAQSVVGTNQNVIGDPFQQILGRSSGAVADSRGVQAGPSLFNPDDPLAASITSGNNQMAAYYGMNSVKGSPAGQAMSSY